MKTNATTTSPDCQPRKHKARAERASCVALAFFALIAAAHAMDFANTINWLDFKEAGDSIGVTLSGHLRM